MMFTTTTSHTELISELQTQKHALEQALDEARHEAEHLRAEHAADKELQAKETQRLKDKLDRLTQSASDSAALRDQIEQLGAEAAKVARMILLAKYVNDVQVAQYERRVEAYEAKLEILKDTQTQVSRVRPQQSVPFVDSVSTAENARGAACRTGPQARLCRR